MKLVKAKKDDSLKALSVKLPTSVKDGLKEFATEKKLNIADIVEKSLVQYINSTIKADKEKAKAKKIAAKTIKGITEDKPKAKRKAKTKTKDKTAKTAESEVGAA